jgi:CheY-like chemotaxis protein
MERKQKVLVVDDEPCIEKFLRTLLEVDGFAVDAVSGGWEAISKIKLGERPDFILLNVLMPEMRIEFGRSSGFSESHNWRDMQPHMR